MRVCWACGPWTHERLHVCVYVEEIISVFTDPCQAQRSVEFLWYFLRMIPRPHIFSTHLSAAMKEWTSDNWTVQSKEQQKVQKDSSNAFSVYIYCTDREEKHVQPFRFKVKKEWIPVAVVNYRGTIQTYLISMFLIPWYEMTYESKVRTNLWLYWNFTFLRVHHDHTVHMVYLGLGVKTT